MLNMKRSSWASGQRIRALELDRILGRQDEEGPIERVGAAGRRDVVLLHRLEERRLRLGWRAVDLVGQDDLREDGARHEAQRSMSGLLVEHLGARDVGWHEVRRELDALEREVEYLRDRLDEQRLGEPRDAGDQTVSAGEERDEHLIDHRILPNDDFSDFGEDALAPARDAFGHGRDVARGCVCRFRLLADSRQRVHQCDQWVSEYTISLICIRYAWAVNRTYPG